MREAEGREQEGLHGVAGGRAVAQCACLFSMLPALEVRPRKGRGAGGGPGSLRGAEAGGGRGRRSEALKPCVHARSKWSMRSLVIPCFDQRRTEAWSGGDGVAAREGVPLRVRTRTSAVLSAHSHGHAYGTLALELLARDDPFCLETPRKV